VFRGAIDDIHRAEICIANRQDTTAESAMLIIQGHSKFNIHTYVVQCSRFRSIYTRSGGDMVCRAGHAHVAGIDLGTTNSAIAVRKCMLNFYFIHLYATDNVSVVHECRLWKEIPRLLCQTA
jgi:hypothetical protein